MLCRAAADHDGDALVAKDGDDAAWMMQGGVGAGGWLERHSFIVFILLWIRLELSQE